MNETGSTTAFATAIPGAPFLLLGSYDLGAIGYEAHEYRIDGEAMAYAAREPGAADMVIEPVASAPYATRVVVLAPLDTERFNGTVYVEWLNVTGGIDSPAVWLMAHREIIRSGAILVAVSAQKAGVDGAESIMGPNHSLKVLNPERYQSLHHPGDAFSYDIFSATGRLVREDRSGILGDYVADRVIAVGESQSAAFLITYVNDVDPVARVYDGFLIHSRFGGAAQLDGKLALVQDAAFVPVRLKTDLRVPVLTFICETDLVGFLNYVGYHVARTPDNHKLRTWELAGAAHADNYTIIVSQIDTGAVPIDQLAAAYAPTTSLMGQAVGTPINFGPQHHYVLQAALHALERWVRSGEAPAQSPQLELVATDAGRLSRDSHGIAKGGIRTPWVDVPTARLSGEANPGDLMAAIFGKGEVFSLAQLQSFYPNGKSEYLQRFRESLQQAIAQGFVLPADEQEVFELAALMYPEHPQSATG